MSHTTVHIEIHQKIDQPAKDPVYRGGRTEDGQPARKEDIQIVNVTARVEGISRLDLESAINKAMKHLMCEMPERADE